MAAPSDASEVSTSKNGYQTHHIEDKGSAENIETRLEERHIMRRNTEYFNLNPNNWARIRNIIREPAAELIGTMVLVMFGTAVDCQVVLSSNTGVAATPKGDYLSLNFGWAVGTALGVYISGGISGGHINPAVTLALAVFRGFPWWKVPLFWISQLMGAFIGSGLVFANYMHAIHIVDPEKTVPGTASLFSTYAAGYLPNAAAFWDEFLGTFLLLIVILAITDKRNSSPPPGLVPLVLFILILGIGAAFGVQTGYAINPARDLGPRIMTAMVGYGKEVFNFRHQYWIWCPIMGPFLGALFGALVYDTFLFVGDESIINRPNATARSHHAHAARAARDTVPGGIDIV